jgi:hypothetical protein
MAGGALSEVDLTAAFGQGVERRAATSGDARSDEEQR